jgi:hypothetical protein
MTEHDPLCVTRRPLPDDVMCLCCEDIARVRADERAKVLAEYGLEEKS